LVLVNRPSPLPPIVFSLALASALVAGVAASLTDPLPLPATAAAARIVVVTGVPMAATETATPTAVVTPHPTATELPDCQVTLFRGSVCSWPSATAEVPLPTCGTPQPGAVCIREGAAVVTMIGATQTATPPFGTGDTKP
jgi:hypothetical protein